MLAIATPAQADAERQRATRELCRRSFRRFCQEAIRNVPAELNLDGPIRWSWYLDAIAEHLEAWELGEFRRLLINVKNKSWKSGIGSVLLPPWAWLQDPRRQYFTGGHAQKLAIDHTRMSRDVIRSAWYRALIPTWAEVRAKHGEITTNPPKDHEPAFETKDDQDVKSHYVNTLGGHRYAGWPPAGTGARGNRFVIDDPVGIHESRSETATEDNTRWAIETVMSRMNNPRLDAYCLIQHRLDVDDTSGRLIDRFGLDYRELGFVVLKLPLEYDPKRVMVVSTPKGDLELPPNPLGWRDPRSEEGESLDPQRWGPQEIQGEKMSQMDTYDALSNQDPKPTGGRVLQPEWGWKERRWSTLPDLRQMTLVQSWDPNLADPNKGRNVEQRSLATGHLWGFHNGRAYLIDRMAGRWAFDVLEDQAVEMFRRWPRTRRIWIEATVSGPALASRLMVRIAQEAERLGVPMPVVDTVTATESKHLRFVSTTPYFKSGQVWFPRDEAAPWVPEVVAQHERFPSKPNDDVDCTSQVLRCEWLPKDGPEQTAEQVHAGFAAALAWKG